MNQPLLGKVAVVTGGASGIGRASALRLAEAGASVAVGDVLAAAGCSTAEALAAATGRDAVFVATDVARMEDCEALVTTAVQRFGRVDVLVAAAGITHAGYRSGDSSDADPTARSQRGVVDKPVEDWEHVLAVNLTGTMLACRAFARQLIAQGEGGRIVTISSGAARIPFRGAAEYCVSKAGISMLTRVLALELARHRIHVNAVAPGLIETPMTRGITEDEGRRQRAVAKIPLGRVGTPDDIAAAVLFLATEESSFITGQIIEVDGGQYPR